MSIKDWLNEYADHNDMPLLTADGLDDAIVGICHRFNQMADVVTPLQW